MDPSGEVAAAAKIKAAELCGWTQAAASRRQRLARLLLAPNVEEVALKTDQFYLKAGSPAADVVELARRLCADMEVQRAKQLEEVPNAAAHPSAAIIFVLFLEPAGRPACYSKLTIAANSLRNSITLGSGQGSGPTRRRIAAAAPTVRHIAPTQVGDRLEAELEQVKAAETKQEGARAHAAVREQRVNTRTKQRELAAGLAFVVGACSPLPYAELTRGLGRTPRGASFAAKYYLQLGTSVGLR